MNHTGRSAVCSGASPASSEVECVNSVVRTHECRHRSLTRGLLDLKRLFWNCRSFLEGKRKRHRPDELLDLRPAMSPGHAPA